MTDDRAFLASIARAPADAVVRLVYADWLEERHDPRAELIRVDEEMRTLPAFADRYWQLKARRNELRATADAGWRDAMGYAAVRPVFAHGVPDDARGRWRIVRAFVERWYGHNLPDAGGQAVKVAILEMLLRRTLPPAVREWLAFVDDLIAAGGGLRDGNPGISEIDSGAAMSLLLQAEDDVCWAVRHADWSRPDPPVYAFVQDEAGDQFVPEDESHPVADTTTGFALDYMVNYLQPRGGRFDSRILDSAPLRANLRATFPVCCEFGGVEYYEADKLLVRIRPSRTRPNRSHLTVAIADPTARRSVPTFLRACTDPNGLFRGEDVPNEL